jgi:type II secretion system protein G
MRNRILNTRPGFTLIEVLVTLVLIALLVGVIVPSVINQLGSGEPTRVAQDLEAVRSGVKLFRVDVRRFPHTPEQLTVAPANWIDSTDYGASVIPNPLIDRWNGPYLEMGSMVDGGAAVDTMYIALSAMADDTFSTDVWSGNNWLYLGFSNLTAEQAQAISEVIDGDTITANDDTGGRVRWSGTQLLYYIVPIN